MRFEIVLAPQAAQDLRRFPARIRSEVRDAMEKHMRHEPTKRSRSRIKRLRGMAKPQYRLRVGETKVFYDVREQTVEVLAIVAKKQAEQWLTEYGEAEPDGSVGEDEG